jgi:hypothetical protein
MRLPAPSSWFAEAGLARLAQSAADLTTFAKATAVKKVGTMYELQWATAHDENPRRIS